MNEFKKIWQGYLKGEVKFSQYYEAAQKHIGWTYSYKGVNINCRNAKKDTAFTIAYEAFQRKFGIFGVIEDDIKFNPIFE